MLLCLEHVYEPKAIFRVVALRGANFSQSQVGLWVLTLRLHSEYEDSRIKNTHLIQRQGYDFYWPLLKRISCLTPGRGHDELATTITQKVLTVSYGWESYAPARRAKSFEEAESCVMCGEV